MCYIGFGSADKHARPARAGGGLLIGESCEKEGTMKRRILSLVLCFVVCVNLLPVTGLAAGRDVSFEESLAQDLKTLNLFKGISETDFDLKRSPSRIEALVMLIRSMGKEAEALSGTWRHPFSDVPSWADPYVGYAYNQGLSNGVSQTEFGTSNATAEQYLTFVLRALGYSDVNGTDFTWNDPYSLANGSGILPAGTDTTNFWRADVVRISYAALAAYLKNSDTTLAQKLIAAGVFTQQQFDATYRPDAFAAQNSATGGELTSEQIYAQCSPAVVYVEVYDNKGEALQSGSGFFINASGVLVTNYHVIDGGYSAKVEAPDGAGFVDVLGVYAYDEQEDWAVLQADCNGNAYLEIGDPSSVVGGATVYAIGSPLGLQNSITQGIVSNSARVVDGITYIQTNTAISHGSSGGALINKSGKVIGITTGSITDGQNLNFALPITYVKTSGYGSYSALSTLGGNAPAATTPSRTTNAVDFLSNLVRSKGSQKTYTDGRSYYTYCVGTYDGLYSSNSGKDFTSELYIDLEPNGDLTLILFDYLSSTGGSSGYDASYYTACRISKDLSSPYLFYISVNVHGTEATGYGDLYPAGFDYDSSVTFDEYEGDRDIKSDVADSVVDGICTALLLLESDLLEDNGYTLKDLGFSAL